jgi:hypothetical protein
VALIHCRHLVGDVVDQRVGAVAVLGDLGHDPARQRRHGFGLAGHRQALANQVDAEPDPRRRADPRRNCQPYGRGGDRRADTDLEAEPVPDIGGSGAP